MFNFSKHKLPPRVQKTIAPEAEFIKKAKGNFLAAFDAHYGAVRPTYGFVFAMRAMAVVLVLFGATAGATVYADTQNVPVNSPLYALKRLGETVQLTLASPELRPQLEATFAARRVVEINALEQSHPSSTLIPALANDLDKEVNASIIDVSTSTGNSTEKVNVCGKVLSILSTSSSAMQGELLTHPEVIARFENRCGGTVTGIVTTSTTITTTIIATNTIITNPTIVSPETPDLPVLVHHITTVVKDPPSIIAPNQRSTTTVSGLPLKDNL